ncbi:sporulation histidine kinase inhibitor Sda [Virgibacillus sp. CBA3643]
MNGLSDDLLVETYHQAKSLNLAPDFIKLIKKEMEQRALLLI